MIAPINNDERPLLWLGYIAKTMKILYSTNVFSTAIEKEKAERKA